MNKKVHSSRILVASLTDHHVDGRVARQIEQLSTDHTVISAGSVPSQLVRERVALKSPPVRKDFWHRASSLSLLLSRCYERHYWSRPWVRSAARSLADVDCDLLLVNDFPLLPIAIRVSRSRPVVFDAHEYYPRQGENERRFRLLMKPYYNALCKRYLPQTRSMLTVSAGLAKEYAREFGVDPVLIRNAPSFEKLEPSRRGNRIRIVYHGVAQRRRNLESLIDVVRAIGDGFELHFMLKTRQSRLQELKQHAAGCDRIHFHPPVLSQEIARTINQYDIGVAFFPPVTFNLKHCLPNKFFEYIQGRLGVLVGPTPDMAEIVEREGCGVIARDFSNEALYEALTELSSDKVERMKQRSHEIASTYCWDVESERFRTVISDALEGPR